MKFTKKFKENAALVVLGVVLFWGLTNYDKFFRLLGVMIGVLKPVIFGCIIAFILNVPMSGIEKRLFKKPKKEKYAKTVETLKRPCSIVLTFLLCLGVVALVCWLIIPALIKTFSQLSDDIPVLISNISNKLNNSPEIAGWLDRMNISTADIIDKVTSWLKDGVVILNTLSSTVSFVTDLFSGLVNFFLGICFAVYMLGRKRAAQRPVQAHKLCFSQQSYHRPHKPYMPSLYRHFCELSCGTDHGSHYPRFPLRYWNGYLPLSKCGAYCHTRCLHCTYPYCGSFSWLCGGLPAYMRDGFQAGCAVFVVHVHYSGY